MEPKTGNTLGIWKRCYFVSLPCFSFLAWFIRSSSSVSCFLFLSWQLPTSLPILILLCLPSVPSFLMSLPSGHTEKLTGFSESVELPFLISNGGEKVGECHMLWTQESGPSLWMGSQFSQVIMITEEIRCTCTEYGLHKVTYLRVQSIGD